MEVERVADGEGEGGGMGRLRVVAGGRVWVVGGGAGAGAHTRSEQKALMIPAEPASHAVHASCAAPPDLQSAAPSTQVPAAAYLEAGAGREERQVHGPPKVDEPEVQGRRPPRRCRPPL